MALDKAILQAAIKSAFLSRFPPPTPAAGSTQYAEMDNLAGDLSDAIDAYVKSADVIYSGNLTTSSGPVSAGSPTTTIAQLQ